MSSPLAMLKKTRRAPLQGPLNEQRSRQKVPFRRNLLQEFQAGLAADDSSVSPPLASHNPDRGASTSESKAPSKQGAPPSDFELMSAMMRRVALLEETVQSREREIKHKENRISVLEKRLSAQEESASAGCRSGRDDPERRCQQLQNQVHEMENFLNDYGLIWVGDGETSDPSQTGWSFHMNFDLVLQRIRELNVLAGEGESFVQTTATGAKLAKKEPVQLRLYSNGVVMFDGPFRSYQEDSTQQCMGDLMDGYFPSELQHRFPDGVPFEVHDMRHEEFVTRLPWDTFPGEGKAVRGEKDGSTSAVSHQLAGKRLATDQFLDKLPRFVVKAGRVIDVRDALRTTLQQGSSDAQSSSSVTLVETPALQAVMDRGKTFSCDEPQSATGAIALKVKSEDGSRTYVVRMHLSETVGQLRSYLDKHRGAGLPGYDIISAYPPHSFDDDSQTLRSCGLLTNAALLLRKGQRSGNTGRRQ
ncbi:UBX domain-containing protein 11 [Odontesthes bonariensis]|uniref:UBX domain-containing protein 11 n=1 Tax=Odontesthes bonariensis TaxID=219752 RepID=UPI003F58F992